jgi:2-dehydro-3-deoxygalactonokinase
LAAALIAIDWGTSSARAYRLDARGRILDERSAPLGVQKVEPGKFPQALTALLGGDVPEGVPMIACGMIGSRQGWIEAPYRDCPADFEGVAAALTPVPGTRLCIVPGLVCRDADGVPDVMRGEETQIMGALDDQTWAHAAPRVVVLPGTHSKWALVGGRVIEAFATFMTGELYAVLREHSILGRLAATASPDDGAALERGVRASLREAAALPHDLFSARTLALTGALAPEAVADYLSGLLLGAEVAAGRRWLETHAVTGGSVILVGEAALCERYRRALALAGIEATMGPPDAAARGLWRIARHSGMVT